MDRLKHHSEEYSLMISRLIKIYSHGM